MVGKLLSSIISAAAAIFAFIWATALHTLILSIAWLVYRPLYGILLLAGFIVMLVLLFAVGDEDQNPTLTVND